MYELDELTVEGTPRCMGQQQGESLRERVQSLVEHRMAELNGYFEERGEGSIDQIDGVGADCLQQLQAWDPPGYEEHMGVAESAGVDAARLIHLSYEARLVSNFSRAMACPRAVRNPPIKRHSN